jgi:recombination protein RecA
MDQEFGAGAVVQLGSRNPMPVSVIPSGNISLDAALGVGGYPRGRVVEVFGPESSGKTTIALHAIAEAQKLGGAGAFVDAEHALDVVYARNVGVDVESLIVAQPDHGEQALDITTALIASNLMDVVVVDSVAALVPKAELDGEIGDSALGLHARLMTQAMRKITAALARSNAVLIFTNQMRERGDTVYGNPEVTTGGRALRFYSSIRIDVRRIATLTAPVPGRPDASQAIGCRSRIKVVKNKVGSALRQVEVDILYDHGISSVGDLLDAAIAEQLIGESGGSLVYDGRSFGATRQEAREFLRSNEATRKQLDTALRGKLGLLNHPDVRYPRPWPQANAQPADARTHAAQAGSLRK